MQVVGGFSRTWQRLLSDGGAPTSRHVWLTRFGDSAYRVFSFFLMNTLIRFRNFISRRKPNAILLLNMSDRLLKILDV
jgi:hypothetical protein